MRSSRELTRVCCPASDDLTVEGHLDAVVDQRNQSGKRATHHIGQKTLVQTPDINSPLTQAARRWDLSVSQEHSLSVRHLTVEGHLDPVID